MSSPEKRAATGRPSYPVNRLSDSDLSHSAIDFDLYTGDVGRVLRSQERNDTCHFLGLSKPLHRNSCNYFLREVIDGFFR